MNDKYGWGYNHYYVEPDVIDYYALCKDLYNTKEEPARKKQPSKPKVQFNPLLLLVA